VQIDGVLAQCPQSFGGGFRQCVRRIMLRREKDWRWIGGSRGFKRHGVPSQGCFEAHSLRRGTGHHKSLVAKGYPVTTMDHRAHPERRNAVDVGEKN
jgi:hypothetical protein